MIAFDQFKHRQKRNHNFDTCGFIGDQSAEGHALNILHGLGDIFDLLADGHSWRGDDRAECFFLLSL